MAITTPPPMSVPLRTDKDGTIRIGSTRIPLETVIAAFQRGDTPDEIAEGFPTIKLADVYSVIAYYLNNREEVDDYILAQDAEGEQIRRKIEAEHPEMIEFQAELRARVTKKKRKLD